MSKGVPGLDGWDSKPLRSPATLSKWVPQGIGMIGCCSLGFPYPDGSKVDGQNRGSIISELEAVFKTTNPRPILLQHFCRLAFQLGHPPWWGTHYLSRKPTPTLGSSVETLDLYCFCQKKKVSKELMNSLAHEGGATEERDSVFPSTILGNL